ncbi:hypothetical protein [Iodidimonas sp. SYSU 1G8]|uniref:hypothetical protein n=1 Tax=Iodidimonas sp. SYSU 1G8 TaxID=3133967 RepID=UPI0031FE5A8F
MNDTPILQRPRTVLVGLLLLVVNFCLLAVASLGLLAIYSPLKVIIIALVLALIAVLLKNLADGGNWARYIYLGIMVVSLFSGYIAAQELPKLHRDLILTEEGTRQMGDEEPRSWSIEENGTTVIHCPACALPDPDWLGGKLVINLLLASQGVLLTVGLALLFTPSANRWFREHQHSSD